MSCHNFAALLTFVGLVAEFGAVLAILWTVGLRGWVRTVINAARQLRHRVLILLRRLWPWAKPPQPQRVNLGVAEEVSTADSLELQVRRSTEVPPPESLEEVGERLNQIRGDLNRLEELQSDAKRAIEQKLETEVQQVRREATGQAERLDDRIGEQTRRTLGERKREGVTFLVGVLCQMVGAILLLIC